MREHRAQTITSVLSVPSYENSFLTLIDQYKKSPSFTLWQRGTKGGFSCAVLYGQVHELLCGKIHISNHCKSVAEGQIMNHFVVSCFAARDYC